MQNVIQSTNEKGDGILEINVWYGKEASSFVYYEDDGSSYNYENGEYYKREIHFDPAKSTISLSAVEGSFTSKYNKIKLVLHGFNGNIKTFKVNGKKFALDNHSSIFDNDSKAILIDY
jgi:alpha-glucosidase